MAFNSTAGRAEYTATSGQTVFPFLFKIFNETDIEAYRTPSGSTPDDTADLLTITTEYTVTIDGDNGGSITLVTGAGLNDIIVLKRNLPITRTVEYQTSGDLLAETLNLDQEYQTYLVLDGDTNDDRAVRLPATDTSMSVNLPATQPGYGLFVNQAGTAFEYRPADEVGATLQAWEAQAWQKTADSYATEAEDVFVKLYTSDGDGTFTASDTTDYSALHYAAKAATFNPALYALLTGATFTGQVKGITPVSEEDLTRKDYVDTAISTAITAENIDSGTYTPTVSNTTNITASTPTEARYIRIGNIVKVSGEIELKATVAAGTYTAAELSLPITSTFVSQYDASGIFNTRTSLQTSPATGVAVVAANRIKVEYTADTTNTLSLKYEFSYKII